MEVMGVEVVERLVVPRVLVTVLVSVPTAVVRYRKEVVTEVVDVGFGSTSMIAGGGQRFERFLAVTAWLNALLPWPVRTITYRVLLLDLRWRIRTGRGLM